MGTGVLIIGDSGSGKSTSLRNFKAGEIGVLNVAGKRLPFRSDLKCVNNADYASIKSALEHNTLNAYCIDDAGYLLSFDNFDHAKENGYGKFVDMALEFKRMLDYIRATSDDTIVYVMMHGERDEMGKLKPKLIGKMLNEKLCVEGLFTIVLVADGSENGYHFITQTDGTTVAKSPLDMFKDAVIDNDLKAVDTTIREYWGMAKLGAVKQGKRASNEQDA